MIYTIDNNPIASYLMNLAASGVFQFSIRVNCRTGKYLRSDMVSDLLVEGRKLGDVSWTNLETTPLDLSAFNGTRQTYQIRLTAAAVSTRATRTFRVYAQ